MAQLPMNVAFEEARQTIHQAVDAALKLVPAYQVELLLSRYYDDVFKMAQKDYDTNLAAYKAAVLKEQEEAIENTEEQE